MAPHSSTLAWKTPWMEEPGRLQSMGSRRVVPSQWQSPSVRPISGPSESGEKVNVLPCRASDQLLSQVFSSAQSTPGGKNQWVPLFSEKSRHLGPVVFIVIIGQRVGEEENPRPKAKLREKGLCRGEGKLGNQGICFIQTKTGTQPRWILPNFFEF